MSAAGERWRMGLVALALALPFAASAMAARSLLAPLASLAARPLSKTAEGIADSLPDPRRVVPLEPTPEAEGIAAIEGDETTKSTDVARAAEPAITQSGIGVTRARVEAAVKAGIRPSGSGVPATSWRPAGLALYGVSAVGVGLRDGDVLTKVGGSPASSPAAVISAVEAALRRQQSAIVGEVWRGHHRFVLSVELPRVKFRDDEHHDSGDARRPEPRGSEGEPEATSG